MELELRLALPNNDWLDLSLDAAGTCRKRGFDEAFPAVTTLSLFGLKDDDEGDGNQHSPLKQHTLNNGQRVLVGWPPIKCFMRGKNVGAEIERWDGSGGGKKGAKYVKVKMEGVAIGRKVDLSLHRSYDELFQTLQGMFPTLLDGEMGLEDEPRSALGLQNPSHHHHHRTVTYEDGNGDWMLIGDVPWEAFIQSVKRLKIIC